MYAGRASVSSAYEDCLRISGLSSALFPGSVISEGMPRDPDDRAMADLADRDRVRGAFPPVVVGTNPAPGHGLVRPPRRVLRREAETDRDVLAEFQLRWRRLVGQVYAASGGWQFDQAAFDAAAERLFQSPGHGWPGAAVHCPDLQLVARSPAAARAGDYDVILSEIHLDLGDPDRADLRMEPCREPTAIIRSPISSRADRTRRAADLSGYLATKHRAGDADTTDAGRRVFRIRGRRGRPL